MPKFSRAGIQDAEKISELVNSAYRPLHGKAGWTHESEWVAGDRASAELIRAMLVIGAQADRIVSCVYLVIKGDTAFIGLLTVDPRLQGNGLGKRTLAEAERLAHLHWDVKKFAMEVLAVRNELIAFYQRRGYQRTGISSSYPMDANVGVPKVDGLVVEQLKKVLPLMPIGELTH